MKHILLFFILFIVLTSCVQTVLDKKSYTIVDTVGVHKNGFNYVLGYDVVIKYNSEYYFGTIDNDANLTNLNFKPIRIYR